MSKAKALLRKALEAGDSEWYFGTELLTKIQNFLAQPEPEPLTPRQGLEEFKKGYAQAEQDLKREPLSFEDLNNMWCGNPIDFARAIEGFHGIGE